ncbi:hypothetical protein B0H17DRAFT_244694 [Mycena rosella]|uniref:SET domain-containing protein n=1 Tax=Mycena rosella TaxID=1033263 RepID=A0AAD7MC16_MYCRO|nr:hypothetical protein B0H17DRAFT_244694 [Mycena rosella]
MSTVTFELLLDWLQFPPLLVEPRESPSAGIGLFAVASIPASTPLFTIPARALLNSRSLAAHYPPALNAVQLIALHLCLYRPLHPSPSLDPLFGPYISTLPREFDSHPLTSHVKAADPSQLPPSVVNALARLHARYLHDWNTVRGYLRENVRLLSQKPDMHLDRGDDTLQADFLWGWLNVNTRCIYHRIKGTRSHPDNLTLCPILDFANHTVAGPCMATRPSHAERSNAPPIPRLGDPLTLLSPTTPTQPGAELYLTYGAHPNRTLFVEYGFVAPCGPDDVRAEVDVQDIVEPMFKGNDGDAKKKLLQDSGYWGDWTLDGSPVVSYRLITALRLLHVSLGGADGDLQRWRDTLTGLRDAVSDVNEGAWQETVADVCSTLIQRAQGRRKHLAPNGWLLDAVQLLWEEEYHVALRVLKLYN